jgi:hypothetical protein
MKQFLSVLAEFDYSTRPVRLMVNKSVVHEVNGLSRRKLQIVFKLRTKSQGV